MYITCEECSTIFRLDEKLLKPTGSKVRCSQCQYVFKASPPQPDSAISAEPGISPAADIMAEQEDTFDQELEGIDLAELDSILENNDAMPGGDAAADLSGDADELVEFDEADLDLDFESALEADVDDTPVEATADEPSAAVPDEAPGAMGDDLDLEMDFELDDSVADAVEASELQIKYPAMITPLRTVAPTIVPISALPDMRVPTPIRLSTIPSTTKTITSNRLWVTQWWPVIAARPSWTASLFSLRTTSKALKTLVMA